TTFKSQTAITFIVCAMFGVAISGCGSKPQAKHKDFFSSGSRDADQRASQRMAKSEQLEGSGEGSGEKGVKKASKQAAGGCAEGAVSEKKLSLFDRLGGEKGLAGLVDDFTPRLLADPRVN